MLRSTAGQTKNQVGKQWALRDKLLELDAASVAVGAVGQSVWFEVLAMSHRRAMGGYEGGQWAGWANLGSLALVSFCAVAEVGWLMWISRE
ncbi:hypothetical protein HJC23_000782 [Cyclotella cryptica]|uniref:Uncharacterized protein n=1 Tax=Cyclotella cryptica TaxID=29204 RepID=A0ABD3PYT2_9STRA